MTTSGSVPPTGKVNFTCGFNIGTIALNANGVASLTRLNLNADPYPLKAVYVGDANNLSSTSSVLNQLITQATTSAKLTSSPNPSSSGQAVAFAATITSPTVMATGPVTFAAGRTVLGKAQLSGGKAEFTISTLAVGSTKVTATYYGNSNIAKSSATVTQTVNQMAGFPAAADPGVGPLVARAIVSAIANGAAFHNGLEIPAEKCSSVLRSCLVLTTIPFVMD